MSLTSVEQFYQTNYKFYRASPLVSTNSNGFFDASRRPSLAPSKMSADTDPRRSLNLPESRRGSIAPERSPERPIHISIPHTHLRSSVTPEDSSTASSIRNLEPSSVPTTPTEETTSQRLSRASWAFRSGSRSRPTSSSGENRKSSTFARLVRSAEKLPSKDVTHSALSLHPLDTSTTDINVDINQIATSDPESPTKSHGKLHQSQSKIRLKSKEQKGKLLNGDTDYLSHKGKLQKELPDRQCVAM